MAVLHKSLNEFAPLEELAMPPNGTGRIKLIGWRAGWAGGQLTRLVEKHSSTGIAVEVVPDTKAVGICRSDI